MDRGHNPHLLRAIGRAWAWRRMERGEVAAIADLAGKQGISDRYVSRLLRLAWLAPEVLERPGSAPGTLRDQPCMIYVSWRGRFGKNRQNWSSEIPIDARRFS